MSPLLLAFALLAAEDPTPKPPDYSQDALLRILAIYDDGSRPPVPRQRHFHLGYVEWHALGMDWRIVYLPIVMPLSGSGYQGAHEFPNPFKLTGTGSTMPPMFMKDRPRDVEREFRRIQKMKAKTE